MEIADLNVVGIVSVPSEADAVPLIDTNLPRVLRTDDFFELVAGRQGEVGDRLCSVDREQFAESCFGIRSEALRCMTRPEKLLGVAVLESGDHDSILARLSFNVNR